MATIGVLTYTLPPGLKLNTNFNKQQTINFPNNNSTIITKIEDISMLTSQVTTNGDVLIMRKKQKLSPLQETVTNNQNKLNDSPKPPPAKKQKLSSNTIPTVCNKNVTIVTTLPLNNISNIIQQPPISTIANKSPTIEILPNLIGGKKSNPLPQAVARRNARERNRVKQVNNGFAALRQRIPDEVAEAFEAAGNGRGTAKKLSKVETLRMAVEYIRSLEKILGIEFTSVSGLSDMSPLPSDDDTSMLMNSDFMSPSTTNTTSTNLDTVIKTEYCSSTPTSDDHERFDDNSLYDPDESSVYFTDNLPDVTTINGQQYLRIPGTNTYQLITPEVFENEENIQPLITTTSSNINYLDNSIGNLVNSQQQQLGYSLSGGLIHHQQQQQLQPQQISPNLINVNNAPALISSDQYSNNNNNSIGMQSSTSPANIIVDQHIQQQQQQQNLLSQLQMHQHHQDQLNRQQNDILAIKTEQQQQQIQQHVSPIEIIKMNYNNQLAPNSSPLSSTNDDDNHVYHSISSNDLQLYDGVMTIKNKIKIENDCSNNISSGTTSSSSLLLNDNNDATVEVAVAAAAAVAGLSDESMMEAIDWWEAHTPKSEHNSIM